MALCRVRGILGTARLSVRLMPMACMKAEYSLLELANTFGPCLSLGLPPKPVEVIQFDTFSSREKMLVCAIAGLVASFLHSPLIPTSLPVAAAQHAVEASRAQAAAAAEAARAVAHVDAVMRVPLWGHAAVCAVSVAVTLAAAAWASHRLYTLEQARSEAST